MAPTMTITLLSLKPIAAVLSPTLAAVLLSPTPAIAQCSPTMASSFSGSHPRHPALFTYGVQ